MEGININYRLHVVSGGGMNDTISLIMQGADLRLLRYLRELTFNFSRKYFS